MNNYINFIKMHGLGNDFVLIDNRENNYQWKDKIQILTDRRIGIGCDQLIVLEQSNSSLADVTMKIINTNASYAKACGNAMRCVARYLFDSDYSNTNKVMLATKAGNLFVERNKHSDITHKTKLNNNRKESLYYSQTNEKINSSDDYIYTAQLAKPKFDWQDIPISKSLNYNNVDISNILKLELPFNLIHLPCVVNTGNPHLLFFLKDKQLFLDVISNLNSSNEQLETLSNCLRKIQGSKLFPDSVNISLAFVRNSYEVDLLVYERGVGYTFACGSAASAVCAVGSKIGLINNQVNINFKFGSLMVKFIDNILTITGSAEYVFKGRI